MESIILRETPSAYGYSADKWTGPMITDRIKTEFGIEYKDAEVYNILDKIGIVFLKGRGLVKA